jgi:hypothetical protein
MNSFFSTLNRRLDATRDAVRYAEPILLVQVIAFASSVPLLMRLKPRTLERLLTLRHRSVLTGADDAVARIVQHLRMASRVASPLVRSGCLTRGLTLFYFLRRAGIDVSLSFGMRGAAGEFKGHCWLTRGGAPFLERQDPRPLYAHVFSIPSAASDATPPTKLSDVACA